MNPKHHRATADQATLSPTAVASRYSAATTSTPISLSRSERIMTPCGPVVAELIGGIKFWRHLRVCPRQTDACIVCTINSAAVTICSAGKSRPQRPARCLDLVNSLMSAVSSLNFAPKMLSIQKIDYAK